MLSVYPKRQKFCLCQSGHVKIQDVMVWFEYHDEPIRVPLTEVHETRDKSDAPLCQVGQHSTSLPAADIGTHPQGLVHVAFWGWEREAVSDKYWANATDVKMCLPSPPPWTPRSIICLVLATILRHFPKITLTVELALIYLLSCVFRAGGSP